MSNAPSFDCARETLAGLLDDWVFGTVISVKVPDAENEYFHGMVKTSNGRAWFQQSKRSRKPARFGPICVPVTRDKPSVGDVLMGRVDPNGKTPRLLGWHGHAKAMRELSNVCLNGTRKREFQLLGDMRTSQGDTIWALCRLIMFGNVQVFADAYETNTSPMTLCTSPLEFVHETSTSMCDPSIWAAFVRLVPTAQPPVTNPSTSQPPEPTMWEPPVTNPYTTPFTLPPYNPVAPNSPPYNPVSPNSPPYNPPDSPPYNPVSPDSPPYNPTPPIDIEAFSALIEKYCPPVQEYDPEHPAYT